MRKFGLWGLFILLSLFPLLSQSAKKRRKPVPTPGRYFYCNSSTGKVEQIELRTGNVAELMDEMVVIPCPSNLPMAPQCVLERVAANPSITRYGKRAFIWTPKVGAECGVGCDIGTVYFVKIRKKIKSCTMF